MSRRESVLLDECAAAYSALLDAKRRHYGARRIVAIVEEVGSPVVLGWAVAPKYGNPRDTDVMNPRPREECERDIASRLRKYLAASERHESALMTLRAYRTEPKQRRRVVEIRNSYLWKFVGKNAPPAVLEAKRAQLKLRRLLRETGR